MDTKNIEFLTQLQKKVERAKNEVARLEAENTVLLKQLKEQFDCKTFSDAKEKLEDFTTKIKKQEKVVNKMIEELKEKYNVITDTTGNTK